MSPPRPPDWIEVHPGTAPLVLLAPHGGRRHAARQPGQHKVNDLHTADVTDALAARTGATAIVNRTRDRNDLDLNRVKQVRERAPWLLALLADTLEREVARAGHVTLLVIHGWNIGQPACDVGIGMVERDGTVQAVREQSATVGARFLDRLLPRLRDAGGHAGVAVTVGARYPAAHPNNLMQLFTPAHRNDPVDAVRRLSELAASGSLDAAQLELGIPLRWPGDARERLLDVLVDVTTGERTKVREPIVRLPARLGCGGSITERRAVQFAHDDLFGLSAVEIGADGSVGGRLLLSTATGTVELFTGELGDRSGPRWHVPPLRFGDEAADWQLEYEGPLLSFANLEPFLDLENGLAAGRLVNARADLAFRARDGDGDLRFGEIVGEVRLGARSIQVQTRALCTTGAGAPTRGLPSLRLTVPHAEPGPIATGSTASVEGPEGLQFEMRGHVHGEHPETLGGTATLQLNGHGGTLSGRLGSVDLAGRVERMIPIRRPGKPGTVIHTTYGLYRPERIGGTGWLELVTEHPLPVSPPAR